MKFDLYLSHRNGAMIEGVGPFTIGLDEVNADNIASAVAPHLQQAFGKRTQPSDIGIRMAHSREGLLDLGPFSFRYDLLPTTDQAEFLTQPEAN